MKALHFTESEHESGHVSEHAHVLIQSLLQECKVPVFFM